MGRDSSFEEVQDARNYLYDVSAATDLLSVTPGYHYSHALIRHDCSCTGRRFAGSSACIHKLCCVPAEQSMRDMIWVRTTTAMPRWQAVCSSQCMPSYMHNLVSCSMSV